MVGTLLDQFVPGDLLIRDRGLFGDALIAEVLRRGAHFLARAKCNSVLTPIRSLPEGAFLSKDPSERGRPTARLQRVVAPWHRMQLRRSDPVRLVQPFREAVVLVVLGALVLGSVGGGTRWI